MGERRKGHQFPLFVKVIEKLDSLKCFCSHRHVDMALEMKTMAASHAHQKNFLKVDIIFAGGTKIVKGSFGRQ